MQTGAQSMSDFTRRIVVLGKTGTGKSSLANIIFGEPAFKVNHSPESGTSECQAKTKCVSEKWFKWIDTPGFFDTVRSEEVMKQEIVRCITECAPGPHAFLIVLKVEKFTVQEKDVIKKLLDCFSEKTLQYAAVIFTHGDQLPDEMKIEEFVSESEDLSDLVRRCGNRCHVIDNKYWKNNQRGEYRSNGYQVAKLLNTIDKIIEENNGGYYNNEMLQSVEEEIKQEEVHIRQSSANISPGEITCRAKTSVSDRMFFKAVGLTTGALLGAFLGGAAKLMKEGPTVALVVGVTIGTAAGMAAYADTMKGAPEAEAPTPPAAETTGEHQE